MKKVKVRWIDGFEKYYLCKELQFGKDNYWFKLFDDREKWVPREHVRHVTVTDDNTKTETTTAAIITRPNF